MWYLIITVTVVVLIPFAINVAKENRKIASAGGMKINY